MKVWSLSLHQEFISLCFDKKDYEGLPFDFYGGYIGYIGYDLKAECGVASNLLFVESPAIVAMDMHIFMVVWVTKFPAFKSREIYLTGESYAGLSCYCGANYSYHLSAHKSNMFCLWPDRKLCMREDGRQQVCIVGLQEFEVSDVQVVKEYIERGNGSRSTGSTGANEESSRSHVILQLVIKKHNEVKDSNFR